MVHVVDSLEMISPGTYRLRRVSQETWVRTVTNGNWVAHTMSEQAYLAAVSALRSVFFSEPGGTVLRDGDTLAIIRPRRAGARDIRTAEDRRRNCEFYLADYRTE